jgi:hypothetical protein
LHSSHEISIHLSFDHVDVALGAVLPTLLGALVPSCDTSAAKTRKGGIIIQRK